MTINRTFDMELVRQIITSPEVYPHVSDDGSPSAEEYRPPENQAVYYLGISDDGPLDGVFVLMPQNVACVEVHTCLRKPLWGIGVEAALRGIQWVWENTSFQRIVTNVPTPNRLAARLSLRAGMTLFGTNTGSFLKNGRLYDQMMFGISRSEKCQ